MVGTVSFNDIEEATKRLKGVAHITAVVTSTTLNCLTQGEVFLKCENFQRMGAFKFRGAYNRIAQLSSSERHAGVVSYSSGNHAQAVALASKILGVQATIVMPSDAPISKLNATKGYGAQVVLYERRTMDRQEIALDLAKKTGAVIVPPFDDPMIVAGQGTTVVELLKEVGSIDLLLVPTGGGGLLSGCALATKAMFPKALIYGVEPEAGNDFAQSLETGKRIKIAVPETIADGLQTQMPGEITFDIVQRLGCGMLSVSDDQLRQAMLFAFERLKLIIEPSGGAALAAALFNKIPTRGKRIGVVISGGNVDPEVFSDCLLKAKADRINHINELQLS